jgi:hypothetical protein
MTWYRRALGFVPGRSSGGALQTLLATTEREDQQEKALAAKSLSELIGPAAPEAIDLRVLDPVMGSKLWDVATELTRSSWREA